MERKSRKAITYTAWLGVFIFTEHVPPPMETLGEQQEAVGVGIDCDFARDACLTLRMIPMNHNRVADTDADGVCRRYRVPDPGQWPRVYSLLEHDRATPEPKFKDLADQMRMVYGLRCMKEEGQWVAYIPDVSAQRTWNLCDDAWCGIEEAILRSAGPDKEPIWYISLRLSEKGIRDLRAFHNAYQPGICVITQHDQLLDIVKIQRENVLIVQLMTRQNESSTRDIYFALQNCILSQR